MADTGQHASNPDVLNVEVEFRGNDAVLIDKARNAMGPTEVTYADVIQRLAVVGAKALNNSAPHIIALIAVAAAAPWVFAFALGGA